MPACCSPACVWSDLPLLGNHPCRRCRKQLHGVCAIELANPTAPGEFMEVCPHCLVPGVDILATGEEPVTAQTQSPLAPLPHQQEEEFTQTQTPAAAASKTSHLTAAFDEEAEEDSSSDEGLFASARNNQQKQKRERERGGDSDAIEGGKKKSVRPLPTVKFLGEGSMPRRSPKCFCHDSSTMQAIGLDKHPTGREQDEVLH